MPGGGGGGRVSGSLGSGAMSSVLRATSICHVPLRSGCIVWPIANATQNMTKGQHATVRNIARLLQRGRAGGAGGGGGGGSVVNRSGAIGGSGRSAVRIVLNIHNAARKNTTPVRTTVAPTRRTAEAYATPPQISSGITRTRRT